MRDAETAQGKAETAQGKAEYAQGKAEDAQAAAEAAANSVGYVSFAVTAQGHVIVQNAERLGTSSFTLNNNGHLEVEI